MLSKVAARVWIFIAFYWQTSFADFNLKVEKRLQFLQQQKLFFICNDNDSTLTMLSLLLFHCRRQHDITSGIAFFWRNHYRAHLPITDDNLPTTSRVISSHSIHPTFKHWSIRQANVRFTVRTLRRPGWFLRCPAALLPSFHLAAGFSLWFELWEHQRRSQAKLMPSSSVYFVFSQYTIVW